MVVDILSRKVLKSEGNLRRETWISDAVYPAFMRGENDTWVGFPDSGSA